MATDTSIEWADKTWSPIIGCDRVSPGCDQCYAINTAHVRSSHPNAKIQTAFAGTTERVDGRVDWTGQINLLDSRLTEPLSWKKPRKVYVNSMSDLFHKDVPDEYVAKVFAVMALTPQHTYQVLTKRHGRMRSLLNDPTFEKLVDHELLTIPAFSDPKLTRRSWPLPKPGWPLPNVWLGVSVEDQKRADLRIPALTQTPAVVRFLSCEPLLGPVDVSSWLGDTDSDEPGMYRDGIHWVIAGGESGRGARAVHPDWIRSLRDQSTEADVPFFMKQWGEWGPAPFIVRVCDPEVGWKGTQEELAVAKADSEACGATHVHTGNWYEEDGERRYHLHEIGHKPWSLERVGLPEGTAAIRRWGKKAAGRELDGRTWDEFPVVPA